MKKINLNKIIIIAIVFTFIFQINTVFAVESNKTPDAVGSNKTPDAVGTNKQDPALNTGQSLVKLQNPLNAGNIQDVIYLAIDLAIYLGVAFAVIAIVYVGFKFILAQGKPEDIKEAKMWFFYIIIGLAILISSKVIVEIVKTTFINSGVVDKNVFERRN